METLRKQAEIAEQKDGEYKTNAVVKIMEDKTGMLTVSEYVTNGKGELCKSGKDFETTDWKNALRAFNRRVKFFRNQ